MNNLNSQLSMGQPSLFAIIVAGGKGLRMGGPLPKQFMPIGGRPVLMHTIECLRRAAHWRQMVLVLPADQHALWRKLCHEHGFNDHCTLANGGQTRFHSVANGLAMLPANASGIVAVHDGVRPFASPTTITKCCQAAHDMGAAVPVTPVIETLRHIRQGTVPRQDYRLVQTPQTFRLDILRQAYAQPYQDAFTDDASVVEAMGQSVALTEGNRENIKLTTPIDMAVAEALLAQSPQHPHHTTANNA